ncbi:probable cytochrome P450 317a1 [Lucilia cuprina]|uniref:probable cytochrome P450 317a1 n=1 Tax=Lucilia cuprina TaxID=7375 RepID=UPI001F060A6A|nr:probable cytochrome P450 317a1 [Lucilia cuprina]
MWIIFLILGLIIFLLITLCGIGLKYIRDYWHFLGVPHDRPKPLVDIIKTLSKYGTCKQLMEQHEYFQKLYKRFKGTGPYCGFYHLLEPRVLVLDQELMQQILVKNFSNFNDRGCYHNMKNDPLSADLYSLSGEKWKEMRLKLEPVFQKAYMKAFHESIREECEKTLLLFELKMQEESQRCGHREVVLDVQPLMHRFVLGNIAKMVFGLTQAMYQKYPLDEFDAMTQFALHTHKHGTFLTTIMQRYPNVFRSFKFSTTKKKVQTYFLSLLNDVINHRDKCGDYKDDYLQLLINIMNQEMSTHETEVHTDPKELRDHLVDELAAHAFTFLRAGLEPTSKTLTYALYELARDPVMQQRVREEILKAYEENDQRFSYECIHSLKFVGQIISETLRLHPVIPYIMRRALNDYQCTDHPQYLIRKDMYVIIPTHAIHNDPALYTQPHAFNPDRFSAQDNKRRQSCLWLGFGEGPRNCLGLHFAQLQMRLILAQLLHKYEFTLDTQHLVVCCQEGVALRVKPLHERFEYVEYEGRESAVEI